MARARTYTHALGALIAAGLLAGCSSGQVNQPTFDGMIYKAKATSTREDRRAFVIEVSPVSQGAFGALEAGRYEATKYCVRTYGSSKMSWEIGPDTPPEQIVVVDDTLTLAGRCIR